MVDREELEYSIKYPFTSTARKIVEEAGFDLDNPPAAVMDRARQRVEESLSGSFEPVKSTSETTLLTELLSYPLSKILVALTRDRSIIEGYSRAESERLLRELLRHKDRKLLDELALELGVPLDEGKVSFSAYAQASPMRHPLVNAPLKNGLVEVSDDVLTELIANTFKNRLSEELYRKRDVPKLYEDHAKSFKKEMRQSYATEELGPLNVTAFPPCIKALVQEARAGEKMGVVGSFVLSTFLINVGMPVDQIVDLFANTPNFNAKKTQYYVEYSAGKRGSGVKYTPPSCKKMEFYGLCKGKDALCAGIGHPLSRYARKGRARK